MLFYYCDYTLLTAWVVYQLAKKGQDFKHDHILVCHVRKT